MTKAKIEAEITEQIREKLALLAAKLRESAQHDGPSIRKTLNQVAGDSPRSSSVGNGSPGK